MLPRNLSFKMVSKGVKELSHQVRHSLIDEKVIQYFLQGYGLSPFSEVRFLTRGLNDTYIIRSEGGTYIYRIYRHDWRTEMEILFEIEAILHLRNNGLPVSYPIKRLDDKYICDINAPEGIRYGVMFSYTEGKRPEINTDNAYMFGVTLGQMHNMSHTFQPTSERRFELTSYHLVDDPMIYIKPVLHRFFGKKAVDELVEITDHLKKRIGDKELETGFCHGDFHNHNMHIHDGQIEVFDFDCCGFGYRGYDVAVTWWNLLHNYKNQEVECWDSFLKGYSSQRSLSQADMDSLPIFITIRRIWLLGTMLANDDVWGTNWITEEAFEIFMLQVKSDTVRIVNDIE